MNAPVVFQKATRRRARARVAIDGPTGSGKTYSALVAATVLANGGKIAVIDTERGSASLYADEFSFDVIELNTFDPRNYVDAIQAAEEAGYSVIVIDSLTHAWEGEGGVLDLHDDATKRQKTQNSFTAWKDITPIHRALVDAMLQSPMHVIATMRSKMEYAQEKDESTGKLTVKKIGLAPIQRAGMEYEFTIVCDMDVDHTLVVTKSRCRPLTDKVVKLPDQKFFGILNDWLNSGEAPLPTEARNTVLPAADEQPKPAAALPERPYTPEVLKARITEKAFHLRQDFASGKKKFIATERQVLAAALSHVFKDDTTRYELCGWLADKPSTKEMAPEYVVALLAWLNVKDYATLPDEIAIKEAMSAHTFALEAKGQLSLEGVK